MAKDKRDRRDNSLLGTFNRQRFEQEVAEEIGISLDRTIGRAGQKAKTAAASPGTGEGAGGSRPKESEAGRRGATIRRGEKETDEKS